MESHLDANQIADLTADLGIYRLRSKTESLVAATQRLLEEVDRSVADLKGTHAATSRLRESPETQSREGGAMDVLPILGRSGIPQALTAIFEGAEGLNKEVDRVRAGIDKYSELLRGTDLGDDARSAVSVAGAFVQCLVSATSEHGQSITYDAARLGVLADGLRNAIGVPGLDFSTESTAFRRPAGISNKV